MTLTRRRSIAVVTGTRAEYGLLYWLLREIGEDPALRLRLVVTGSHLSGAHGMTVKAIEKDGFEVAARIPLSLSDDSPPGIARAFGEAVRGFAETLARLKPDLVVLLGDRYEILACACAAMLARIPIAHIHGGESTEGLIDEQIRHALTKMSHWHFAAAGAYRRRIVQMGEDPRKVWCVGAPGLDHLKRMRWMSRTELERTVGLKLRRPLFLVTYHPVTLQARSRAGLEELLAALDEFPQASVLISKSNADPQYRSVHALLERYAAARNSRVRLAVSLGQRAYLSAMKLADVVIGNSSSGIIEAPAVGTPTVDIGDRQKGRLAAPSVIRCGEKRDLIARAIRRALTGSFKKKARRRKLVYKARGASRRIKDILKGVDLDRAVRKSFRDLGEGGSWR